MSMFPKANLVTKFAAFCLSGLAISDPVWAQSSVPTPPLALSEHDRAVVGGRAVLVELPQSEIATQVDVGRVMSDAVYGGGLLGALILSSNDHKRESLTKMAADKADHEVSPLREALKGFDFDSIAMGSSRSGLSRLTWFSGSEPKSTKSPSQSERETFLKASGFQQLATIGYYYVLSADFTQIRVIADIAVWRQADHEQIKGTNIILISRYTITTIAELRNRSYEPSENIAQWSANDGGLAQHSTRLALARMEELIPFALNLSQADITALQSPKLEKRFAAGFYGPPVTAFPSVAGEALIWSHGLIDAMPAS